MHQMRVNLCFCLSFWQLGKIPSIENAALSNSSGTARSGGELVIGETEVPCQVVP
ncbi:hypothetical protein SAMN05216525_109172 [Bradyrhizobium sp. Gha]|nr:hypothetical protein SAMN05216525_109172 [Bradyrhizobium sp. Gha]